MPLHEKINGRDQNLKFSLFQLTLLYSVYCVLCTVHCILCNVHCILCTVHCVLCTVY